MLLWMMTACPLAPSPLVRAELYTRASKGKWEICNEWTLCSRGKIDSAHFSATTRKLHYCIKNYQSAVHSRFSVILYIITKITQVQPQSLAVKVKETNTTPSMLWRIQVTNGAGELTCGVQFDSCRSDLGSTGFEHLPKRNLLVTDVPSFPLLLQPWFQQPLCVGFEWNPTAR